MNGLLRCLLVWSVVVAPESASAQSDETAPVSADLPADPLAQGAGDFGVSAFGGVRLSVPPGATPSSRYVASSEVIIAWSETGDTAWGFSKATGRWTKHELKPAVSDLGKHLAVGAEVAVIQSGNRYHTYGSGAGRWDTLQLPDGHTPPPTITAQDLVLIVDGETMYTFTSRNGKWTSSADSATTSTPTDARKNAVIRLKYTDAAEIAKFVREIVSPEAATIEVEQTSNTLLISADAQAFPKIEALLKRLDQPLAAAASKLMEELLQNKVDLQTQSSKFGSGHPNILSLKQRIDAIENVLAENSASVAKAVEQRRLNYSKRESVARQMSNEVRAILDKFGPEHLETKSGETSLRRGVAAAFEARQELQRAEVAALQQRLTAIQQSIAAREQNKEEIINRRVSDLLNPALSWEAPAIDVGGASLKRSSAFDPKPKSETLMKLAFNFPKGALIDGVYIPGQLTLAAGAQHRLTLSRIPGHSNLSIPLTVEIPPVAPVVASHLEHNSIGFQISDEDLDQYLAGNAVTKVVYRPHHPGGSVIELLVSTRLDPGIDPLEEARLRGHVVAILRLHPPGMSAGTDATQSDFISRSKSAARAADAQSSVRAATEMRNRLLDLNRNVLSLEQFVKENPHEGAFEQRLVQARQQLAGARDELQAQRKLIQLDLQDAESELEAAAVKREFIERLVKKGFKSEAELQQETAAVEQAKRRIERCKILLDLYQRPISRPTRRPRRSKSRRGPPQQAPDDPSVAAVRAGLEFPPREDMLRC